MKNKKTKIKEAMFKTLIVLILLVLYWNGMNALLSFVQKKSIQTQSKVADFFYNGFEPVHVNYKADKSKKVKYYAYNEQVPKEVVIEEIRKQSKEFNLGENYMINLAFCESGYNNLAKNPSSTAVGVYQYLIKTWEETESWKQHRIARTDYKANIREAMIDISNGENWRWPDCHVKITK